MYNKPITQRVSASRQKSAPLKQTAGPGDTTVLKGEIPNVTDTATVSLPDTTKKVKQKGKVTKAAKDICGPNDMRPSCVALRKMSKEDVEASEVKQGLRTPDTEKEVTVKGGEATVEENRYQYDYGDAMPAWVQRNVTRGLTQQARRTGRLAGKEWSNMTKSEREATGFGSRRDYKKAAKKEAYGKALGAQKLFAETQMEAARQGAMPGSKGKVKIGTFDPNTRVTEVDDTARRTSVGRTTLASDTSQAEQSVANTKKAAQEAAKSLAVASANAAASEEKRKQQEQAASMAPMKTKSPFKMGGYGNKTYKK